MKKIMSGIAVVTLALGLVGCSFQDSQYSPEQVLNNAMKETDELLSYYGEATMTMNEEEEIFLKEWRSNDGKSKVETEGATEEERAIAVNDGTTFTMYQESLNQALVSQDGELLADLAPSPKEQAQQLLKMVGDSHTISVEGEEKIAGRSAYHLIAKENDKDTLFGDQELWVDKENWFVLKMISKSGDHQVDMEYTKIEFDKVFPEDTFTIELPEGVEIQDMDEMNESTTVTIEEAAQNVGQPLLYFPEEDGREITTIEMDEFTGELDRVEINIDYIQNETPLLSLSLFKTPEDTDEEEEMKLPGEEVVEVRGTKGTMIDMEGFRTLFWKEDGLSYSIILNDLDLTFEEVIEWTNDMEVVK